MQTQYVTLSGGLSPTSISIPVNPGSTYVYGARIIPMMDPQPIDPYSGMLSLSWATLDGPRESQVITNDGPIEFVAPASSLLLAGNGGDDYDLRFEGRYMVQLLTKQGEKFQTGRGPIHDGGVSQQSIDYAQVSHNRPLATKALTTSHGVVVKTGRARSVRVSCEWINGADLSAMSGAFLEAWVKAPLNFNSELSGSYGWVRAPQFDIAIKMPGHPNNGAPSTINGVVGTVDVSALAGQAWADGSDTYIDWRGSAPHFDAVKVWSMVVELFEDADP